MSSTGKNKSSAPQKPPVIFSANVSNQLGKILSTLTGQEFIFCLETQNYTTGFQLLSRFGGGVLILALNDPKDLASFHKSLSVLLQAVSQQNLRILIFSRRNEVLDSRALAQFQFIRTYPPAKSLERILELVRREYKTLLNSETWGSVKAKTESVSPSVVVYPNPDQKIDDPLADCIGEKVTSHVFPLDLGWKVRGYFEGYENESAELIFKIESDAAERRLVKHFEGQDVVISSSSGPKGRVCMALEILREGTKTFVFRAPNLTRVIQRRLSYRRKVPRNDNGFARVFDPSRRATRLFTVFDFGPGGVGIFIDPEAAAAFTVGQTVYDINMVLYGKEYTITEAEVRHISKSDLWANLLLLGLKFKKISKADRVQLEVTLFAKSL